MKEPQQFKWKHNGDDVLSFFEQAKPEPVIYSWWRNKKCLYVGQSKQGFWLRVLRHHVINVVEPVLPDDYFGIVTFPADGPFDQLDYWEPFYILRHKPFYNLTHNERNITYESALARANVPELPKTLPAKASMAEALFDPMSERLLLEDPSNCTDDELRQQIAQCKSDVIYHTRRAKKMK